ncbi:MAG TPA: hypothetical protein VJG49_03610 [Candidatus Nanoarchaeia archaeon]|nr:hypothetical protein [Candidatus Nanoarchaeia archaeon]
MNKIINKLDSDKDWEAELQLKEERVEIWEKYKELFSGCKGKCSCGVSRALGN